MSKESLAVGTTVILQVSCLGNNAGTKGVVYEQYTIGHHLGSSVIFENGNYDGFSVKEQESFLFATGNDLGTSGYVFTNVMKLPRSYLPVIPQLEIIHIIKQ